MACARQESEHACDDAVINRGVVGTDYATHLVGIARDLKQQRHWLPAPAIARPSISKGEFAPCSMHVSTAVLSRASYAAILIAMLAIDTDRLGAGRLRLADRIDRRSDERRPAGRDARTHEPADSGEAEVRTDATGRCRFRALRRAITSSKRNFRASHRSAAK